MIKLAMLSFVFLYHPTVLAKTPQKCAQAIQELTDIWGVTPQAAHGALEENSSTLIPDSKHNGVLKLQSVPRHTQIRFNKNSEKYSHRVITLDHHDCKISEIQFKIPSSKPVEHVVFSGYECALFAETRDQLGNGDANYIDSTMRDLVFDTHNARLKRTGKATIPKFDGPKSWWDVHPNLASALKDVRNNCIKARAIGRNSPLKPLDQTLEEFEAEAKKRNEEIKNGPQPTTVHEKLHLPPSTSNKAK